MTVEPVLELPREREIRDELQRLVPADLHGPLGGDDEEFSGENPIDRYPLGRLAPRGVVLEPDTHDELAAADAGDPSEADPEPSAPNVPSLNPSAVGFTAHIDGCGIRAAAHRPSGRVMSSAHPSGRKHSAGACGSARSRVERSGCGSPRDCSRRCPPILISRMSSCAVALAGITGTG